MASIVDERGYNQGFAWSSTQQVRMARRARAILDALSGPARRILELGCGTGELADMLARQGDAEVTGVDLSAAFIAAATKSFGRPKLSFVQADLASAEATAQVGTGWDAVVGNGVLHHLYYRIDEVLPRLKALLRPGSRLVFWEPNLYNPYVFSIFKVRALRKLARLEPDEMAFTPAWIGGHLERAGFSVVECSFRDFLLPVLPFPLVRLVTAMGEVAERVPGVQCLAQSLFIVAAA